MYFEWSSEQRTIFDTFSQSKNNILVSASPGSGKTTLLREIWNRAESTSTLYLAFNKAIVQEAQSKLKEKMYSHIKTFNGLGHSIVLKAFPKIKLDVLKVRKLTSNFEYLFSPNKKYEYINNLIKATQYCKANMDIQYLAEPELHYDAIREIIDYYNLDDYAGIESHVASVLKQSNSDMKSIDFNDQLLYPILYDLSVPQYELVLVDEAQDVSNIQKEMLRKFNSRFIFVGDPHQAIYAFRGALSDSIVQLRDEFHCENYPLTITRRCAQAIVREAQAVYPEDIMYAEDAVEGRVVIVDHDQHDLRPVEREYSEIILSHAFNDSSMLLCRTTAPLVAFAYQLLRAQIPCHVRGRDIGEGFIRYIKKSKCEYINDFASYLYDDTTAQIEIAAALRKESKVQYLLDRKETLEVFIEACKGDAIEDLISSIEELFKDGKGIMLSTIHKAKGLESENVYILARDLMPHKMAIRPWEIEQEMNMKYVAITRAKNSLIYI